MPITERLFGQATNHNDGGNYAWSFLERALADDGQLAHAGDGQTWGPNTAVSTQQLCIGGVSTYSAGTPLSGLNASSVLVKCFTTLSVTLQLSRIDIQQPTTGKRFYKDVNQNITTTNTAYEFSLLANDWIGVDNASERMVWTIDDLKSPDGVSVYAKIRSNTSGNTTSWGGNGARIDYISIKSDVATVSFPIFVEIPAVSVNHDFYESDRSASQPLVDPTGSAQNNAATVISVAGPSIQWTGTSGAAGASNSAYATQTAVSTTVANNAYLRGTGLGFDLPANAYVTRIETSVRVTRAGGSSGNVLLNDFRLVKNGSNITGLSSTATNYAYQAFSANTSNLTTSYDWRGGSFSLCGNMPAAMTQSLVAGGGSMTSSYMQIGAGYVGIAQFSRTSFTGINPATLSNDDDTIVVIEFAFDGHDEGITDLKIGRFGDGRTAPTGTNDQILANADVSSNYLWRGPIVTGVNRIVFDRDASQQIMSAFAAGVSFYMAFNTTAATQSTFQRASINLQAYPATAVLTGADINDPNFGVDYRFRSASGNRNVRVECFEHYIEYLEITEAEQPVVVVQGSRINAPPLSVSYDVADPTAKMKLKVNVPTSSTTFSLGLPVVEAFINAVIAVQRPAVGHNFAPAQTNVGVNLPRPVVTTSVKSNSVSETVAATRLPVLFDLGDAQIDETVTMGKQSVDHQTSVPNVDEKIHIDLVTAEFDLLSLFAQQNEIIVLPIADVDFEVGSVGSNAAMIITMPKTALSVVLLAAKVSERIPVASQTIEFNANPMQIDETIASPTAAMSVEALIAMIKERLVIDAETVGFTVNPTMASEKITAPVSALTIDEQIASISETINVDGADIRFVSFDLENGYRINISPFRYDFGFEDPSIQVAIVPDRQSVEYSINSPRYKFSATAWELSSTIHRVIKIDENTVNIAEIVEPNQKVWLITISDTQLGTISEDTVNLGVTEISNVNLSSSVVSDVNINIEV